MSYAQAWEMIAVADRILMTTHVHPDGDGLGCLAALRELFLRRGQQVEVVVPTPLAPKYLSLHGAEHFKVLDRDISAAQLLSPSAAQLSPSRASPAAPAAAHPWDLVLVADTCTWDQLSGLQEVIRANEGRLLVIDHHATRDDLKHAALCDPTAAAAGQIVMRLLESAGQEISPTMARSLFVSLASDTGWFRFSSTSPEVFTMAARLCELGVETAPIYESLYQSESLAKVKLVQEALATLTLCPGGEVAYFWLSREMFARSGAKLTDTENIIDECQKIAGVMVGLLFVEADNGLIRVSLRSKRDVDMSAVAASFGGGGHARAAGCRLRLPLKESRQAVVAAVCQAMGRPICQAE